MSTNPPGPAGPFLPGAVAASRRCPCPPGGAQPPMPPQQPPCHRSNRPAAVNPIPARWRWSTPYPPGGGGQPYPAAAGDATDAPGQPGYPMAPQPSVGDGIKWAINKFGQNAGVMIAFAAIIMVISFVGRLISNGMNSVGNNLSNCDNLTGQALVDCLNDNVGSTGRIAGFAIGGLLVTLVFWLLGTLAEIGLINASLKITRGEKPKISDLWTPEHFWTFIVVGIIVGLAMLVGVFVFCVGYLIVLWFWQFARYSALNNGGIGASLGESFRLVMANKGLSVVTLLVVFVASIIGVLTCGIGFLVVAPFQDLFMAYMYRQFRGRAGGAVKGLIDTPLSAVINASVAGARAMWSEPCCVRWRRRSGRPGGRRSARHPPRIRRRPVAPWWSRPCGSSPIARR